MTGINHRFEHNDVWLTVAFDKPGSPGGLLVSYTLPDGTEETITDTNSLRDDLTYTLAAACVVWRLDGKDKIEQVEQVEQMAIDCYDWHKNWMNKHIFY